MLVPCCAQSLQSCPTLCDPTDCSLPGSSVHGILQARTGVGCHALLQGIFLTQGSNLCFLHLLRWQACSLPLAPPGKPTEKKLDESSLGSHFTFLNLFLFS